MIFQELSLDLKRLIISFIRRPTDLKSLCLVSKDVHEVATTYLYRRVVLRVGGNEDLRLTAMLHPSNKGLNYVRHLDLRLEKWNKPRNRSDSDDSSSDDPEPVEESVSARFAQLAVKMLLDYLPANVLETFTWRTWEPLSANNFLLLCRKQKKLRYMEVSPMDKNVSEILEKDPKIYQGFTELRRVDIYPDNIDALKVGHKFLEAYPNLKKLRLITNFQSNSSETAPERLSDSSTQPGLISSTLFRHLMPFDTTQAQFQLESLHLDEVDVRYAADTWMKIVKFPNLKTLEVRTCVGADVLFAQLSKPHLRPQRLRKLRWLDEQNSNKQSMEAFEGFLEGISGLEHLNVWLSRVEALPKIDSIVKQKNLKILALYCENNDYEFHTLSEENLNRLCTECSKIRQLGISFPELSIRDFKFSAEYQIFLDIICKLKNLVTLNIRSWPYPREYFEGPLEDDRQRLRFYEHDLQRWTQQIFELFDRDAIDKKQGLGNRSTLSVVSWGPPGKSKRDSSDVHRLMMIPFIRGTISNAFGETSMHAIKTNWRIASFVEPEYQVLFVSISGLYDPEEGLVPKKR